MPGRVSQDPGFFLGVHKKEGADIHPGQYVVFVVEDSPDDREQIIRTLTKSPHIYSVHCFDSGDSLLAHFITSGYYSDAAAQKAPR